MSTTTETAAQTFSVTGMTCDHCVHAVTQELSALEGVTAVDIALDPAGRTRVTVAASRDLSSAEVAAALDEAGDYRLV